MSYQLSYSELVKRDRVVVLIAIAVLTALAWIYTAQFAARMDSMDMGTLMTTMAMPNSRTWSPGDFVIMFVMWAVMMVAMMLPTATPMVLLYTRVMQNRESQGRPLVSTSLFVTGYLIAWVGFSFVATIANWGLHSAGLLSSMMGQISPLVGGLVLLLAGVYQWTPLKNACLNHCRSPMIFLTVHWREGRAGTLFMGLHHGLYCLGCCWMLMALLFVLGIMNLPWIAALSVLVLLEKLVPGGRLVSALSGGVLVVWGIALIAVSLGN